MSEPWEQKPEVDEAGKTGPVFEDVPAKDPLAGNGKERFRSGLDLAASLIELNLLFILTCIPIFTIGASVTALNTTVSYLLQDRGGSTAGLYFRKFGQNFKQSTGLWLIGVLLYIVMALDLYGSVTLVSGVAAFGLQVVAVLGIVLITFLLIYGLSMIGQYEDKLSRIMLNSLLLSLKNAPRSFAMLIVTMSPIVAVLWAPDLLGVEIAVMILLWFSAIAFCNVTLLKDIFEKQINIRDDKTEN